MPKAVTRNLPTIGRVAVAVALLALVPCAEAGGPYSFFSLSPCRVVDTRNAAGPTGGPSLGANTNREFPVLGGSCGVPLTAQAVAFNVTIVQPTDFGNLRMYPAGTPMPLASVINFVTTDFAVANGAIIPIGSSGGNHVAIRVDMPAGSAGKVDVILDVTGYFE
jgi:hypothetical protein